MIPIDDRDRWSHSIRLGFLKGASLLQAETFSNIVQVDELKEFDSRLYELLEELDGMLASAFGQPARVTP